MRTISVKLATAVAAAFVLAVSFTATAQEEDGFNKPAEGWYIEGDLGFSLLDDADNEITDAGADGGGGGGGGDGGGLIVIPGVGTLFPFPDGGGGGGAGAFGDVGTSFESEFDDGETFGAAIGYQFKQAFRAELELRYITNDFDEISAGGGSTSADGEMNATALMANLWYDFSREGRWHPYIGGGIGGAEVEIDGLSTAGGASLSDDDTVLAGQLGAGVGYDLNENFTLTFNYRYFLTDDPEFETDNGGEFESEYQAHLLTVGLRYIFGEAEPPPPPPPPEPEPAPEPPPEPEKNEIDDEPLVLKGVNFDFDKATLRPESKTVLNEVIRQLMDNPDVDVLIAGHTDSIGTDQYNQGLSERRAKSVHDYLVDGGIDAGRLSTKGFGESQPIAPNNKPDGSDNPEGRQKNRRVVLTVQDG